MRTRINLASQPYEDARLYLLRWGSLLGLLLIATVSLVWFTVHSVRRSSDVNRKLTSARSEITGLEQERSRAEEMLALPRNRGTVDKSEYLNSIFARKAFSWTTVFSDMEKIMPPGLRVLSIAPALDEQNQLEVHIIVGGESRDRAIELVQNLEKTPRFRDVALRSDTLNTLKSGTAEDSDPIKFDIVAHYLPSLANSYSLAEGSSAPKSADEATVAQSGGKP